MPYYTSEFMAGRGFLFIPSSDHPGSFLFFEEADGPILASALYGILLIAVVFVMPGGIAYFVRLRALEVHPLRAEAAQASPLRGDEPVPAG